jgi:hypothetical protein
VRVLARHWAGLAGLALAACSTKTEHAEVLPTCAVAQPCNAGVDRVTGSRGASSSEAGAGGQSGEAGAGLLQGTVVEFVADDFSTSVPYVESAIVETEGTDAPIVSATWDGANPFTLQGFSSSSETWISVRPSSGTVTLRTLHPVATNQESTVDLGLVLTDTLDVVFSILTLPQERLAGYGQVVLSFKQVGTNAGVAGVSVSSPDAAFVAYQVGGAWTLDDPRTDAAGLVILGNFAAPDYPGTNRRIAISGRASGAVDVRVAAGAVTLVQIPVNP